MGSKVKSVLRDEFVTGKTGLDWAMIVLGLVFQAMGIAAGFLSGEPESPGLIVSGLTGVLGTVLCSQGKMSFYAFGFVQLFTYVAFFSIPNRLHGETIENVMYFVTMLYGLWAWGRRYGKDADTGVLRVRARKFGRKGNFILFGMFVAGTAGYYIFLKNVPMFGVMDSDPFMDSITSVPAYIAQVLMVAGFREQWLYWFILDVGSVVLAIRAGSWVMTAQFAFWCLNCVYGYWNWTRSAGGLDATGHAAVRAVN